MKTVELGRTGEQVSQPALGRMLMGTATDEAASVEMRATARRVLARLAESGRDRASFLLARRSRRWAAVNARGANVFDRAGVIGDDGERGQPQVDAAGRLLPAPPGGAGTRRRR